MGLFGKKWLAELFACMDYNFWEVEMDVHYSQGISRIKMKTKMPNKNTKG